MLLLSRVAEHLYWAARYVERAEVTARVVSEHTHLLVDLPTSVPLTWEPLLDLPGVPREERGRSEREVVAFLLADPANPSSVLASVVTARANLRATREVLPREAWEVVNS
ncbi:MAG TPA: alpha-E domain-containing protein, partial [Acidimicrobiales bacterium]